MNAAQNPTIIETTATEAPTAESQSDKVKRYFHDAAHAFEELAELAERGADLRELRVSLCECAAGIEQLLELTRDEGEEKQKTAPLALYLNPSAVDLYGPDTPEPVREWRHAVFMCTIAARALAPLELGKLIEAGTRAETGGPVLDPALYLENGRALRQDIQLLSAALLFAGTVKLDPPVEVDSADERPRS